MRSKTNWLASIPFLVVLLAMSFLCGPVLAAEGPAASSPAGEIGMPLVVGGTERVQLTEQDAKLLNLIQNERDKAGLDPLAVDNMLTVLARLKAKDMAEKGYVDHRSPVYGTLEDMLGEAGVKYQEARENLARSYSVESAHALFMRYGTLKERILSEEFDRIGVAAVPAGSYVYVVEIFINDYDDQEPNVPPQNSGDNNGGNDSSNSDSSSTQPGSGAQTASGMTADEKEMYALVNQERARQGLKPLVADTSLLKLARLKAQDMVTNNYFGHNSPTYGSPFDMMRGAGIRYAYAGENLAMTPSVQRAHEGLMNSSGHRANILNANFDRVGIGVVSKGSQKYFVQMFTGAQRNESPDPAPAPVPAPQPEPQPTPGQNSGSITLTQDELKMFQLVNQERARQGVPALKINDELVKLARLKAKDMINKNYFDHTSPTYGSPFDMMKQFGIRYSYAGENLAGAADVGTAHQSLMNSSGHRRNILNNNFTEVGIGIISGGPYGKMYVQMFIQPQ